MQIKPPRPWAAIVGLTALALLVVGIGSAIRLGGDVIGAFAGALISGAGVLLGVTLDRAARRADEQAAIASRIKNVKALITAELVNVTAGLIGAHRFMAGSIRSIEHGASAAVVDLSFYAPRGMPVTATLGSDLLVLSEREIDVLTTLSSSLQLTRDAIAQTGTLACPFGLIQATSLKDGMAHDIGLLAQAFEEFSPDRKLEMPGCSPELASELLRREAAS
jgi:hypothetical protein